jgi:hypothetical protein
MGPEFREKSWNGKWEALRMISNWLAPQALRHAGLMQDKSP